MICKVYNINKPEEVIELEAFSPKEAASLAYRGYIIKSDKTGEVVVDYVTATGMKKSGRYKIEEVDIYGK